MIITLKKCTFYLKIILKKCKSKTSNKTPGERRKKTGSLISIKKNVKDILIPSEEMKIQVYPMDYEEFCDATGQSYSILKGLFETKKSLGQQVNRKLMRDLRIYMAVGGMPQAVEAYIEGNNFSMIEYYLLAGLYDIIFV